MTEEINVTEFGAKNSKSTEHGIGELSTTSDRSVRRRTGCRGICDEAGKSQWHRAGKGGTLTLWNYLRRKVDT